MYILILYRITSWTFYHVYEIILGKEIIPRLFGFLQQQAHVSWSPQHHSFLKVEEFYWLHLIGTQVGFTRPTFSHLMPFNYHFQWWKGSMTLRRERFGGSRTCALAMLWLLSVATSLLMSQNSGINNRVFQKNSLILSWWQMLIIYRHSVGEHWCIIFQRLES